VRREDIAVFMLLKIKEPVGLVKIFLYRFLHAEPAQNAGAGLAPGPSATEYCSRLTAT
jgi:hypothetical protein